MPVVGSSGLKTSDPHKGSPWLLSVNLVSFLSYNGSEKNDL